MTYNQIIKRIKAILQAHRQIRNCYKGLVGDFLTEQTTLYPSAFLQDNGSGVIDATKKVTTFPFRLFLVDLINVSEGTKLNEQDVVSDMMSVAIDFVAICIRNNYLDWRISNNNSTEFVYEDEDDMYAGVLLDFSISIQFTKDVCQVPTDDLPVYVDNENKDVNYMEYVAPPNTGSTITIAALAGKKVLLVVRENVALHPVSNNPASSEFVWDGTNINLGLPVNPESNPGERFLILYRNY